MSIIIDPTVTLTSVYATLWGSHLLEDFKYLPPPQFISYFFLANANISWRKQW